MDPEARANTLLESIEYINISTCYENRPWNTPVYAVYDENLNLYWSSWVKAQHSKNIRGNENVFITLYDSTRSRGSNNGRCLYLKGRSEEVTNKDEIKKACNLLYGDEENIRWSDFMDDGIRKIYKSTPVKAWLNDKSEKQVTADTKEMKRGISLEKLKSLQK